MGFWKSDPTPKVVGEQKVTKRTQRHRARVDQIRAGNDAWLKQQVTGKRGKRIFDGTHDNETFVWEETVETKGRNRSVRRRLL